MATSPSTRDSSLSQAGTAGGDCQVFVVSPSMVWQDCRLINCLELYLSWLIFISLTRGALSCLH